MIAGRNKEVMQIVGKHMVSPLCTFFIRNLDDSLPLTVPYFRTSFGRILLLNVLDSSLSLTAHFKLKTL